jgi:hypothetical protein
MVPMTSLWLPIVLSAVFVFIASSIIHMALGYHRRDHSKLPGEERVLAAMRSEGVSPGAYSFPHAGSMKELGTPEMQARYEEGPVGTMTVLPSGAPAMGKHLALWFGFTLLVSYFAAYLAGRTLVPGTDYLQVFRVVGTAAFLAYGFGEISASIWKGQPWGTTARSLLDALIYGLLTAGTFGWLWPA